MRSQRPEMTAGDGLVLRLMRMLSKPRNYRPSHTTVVAYLALFVALGGSSYAAVTLKRNAVKNRHIAKNAVTAPKVKNASLLAQDFAPGQLPKGDKGEPGAQGEPATALWAMVNDDATVVRGKGVVSAAPSSGSTPNGQYAVTFDRSVENCSYLATLTNSATGGGFWSSPPEGQTNTSTRGVREVVVETSTSAGTVTPLDFNLAVFC
jgi:hypothetical protein